jgi:hypothetical protein
MNIDADQTLRLRAMEIAERTNPCASLKSLTLAASEIYDFLRGTPTVNDVTDIKTTVTDTEQAHNQAALDHMKAFYATHDGEVTMAQPTKRDVGGQPVTASRNLADLLPSVKPHTTYPGQNLLDPHLNIPDDTKRGYE